MVECEVTILVAVYNTEQYLRQCMDSLLGQTLSNIQIICIDDASTDGSLAILREYEDRDQRVEVIALETNRGQAHARNQGLTKARGRYIGFLDSDDWMDRHCLEEGVRTFDKYPATDSVLFHTIYYYSSSRQEEFDMEPFEVLSGHEAFVRSLTWKIHGVYMVKAEIHHRYPYDESAHAFSDDNTTRLHYLASREVRQCEGTYYYRQRADSTSHAFSLRRFDYLKANQSMSMTLRRMMVSRDIRDVYERHRWLNIIDLYMLWFRHRHTLSPIDSAEALHQIRLAWASINVRRLSPKLRWKFGYVPFHRSWFLFRMQEELYFSLRKALRR
ncbi:MAG: glycosyltransferase family 2 protein [Prevotella sp.]